jgi:hypothetical protein
MIHSAISLRVDLLSAENRRKDLEQQLATLPQPTAIVLVSSYGGLGIHTVYNVFRGFPDHFKNLVFVSADNKGTGAIAALDASTISRSAAAGSRSQSSTVSGVPTNFVYNVTYSESSTGQNNGVWQNINSERRSSVASGEGVNGLVFFKRGASPNTTDPRVSVDSVGRGLGTTVPFYTQHKYNTRGAAIRLATGVEARLMEAEAALSKGTSTAYLTTLNSLRSSGGVSGTLADPGNANARIRQFFQERALWLWLTGHRLSDLRRLIRQYGFSAESVFPTGQTIYGAPYGTDVNLPIPFQEKNNPNASTGQCIDRNA